MLGNDHLSQFQFHAFWPYHPWTRRPKGILNYYRYKSLINAAWLYTQNGISHHQGIPEGHGSFEVLQVYTEADRNPQVDLIDQTTKELMHLSETTTRYYLRLVVITRSWKTMNTDHTKVAHYDISQKKLTNVLIHQELASFYNQTRVDAAGVLTILPTAEDRRDNQDGCYLCLNYNANLGL